MNDPEKLAAAWRIPAGAPTITNYDEDDQLATHNDRRGNASPWLHGERS